MAMEMSSLKGHPTRTVLSLAVTSRVLVAALFILWRNVANPYDTSADLSLPCLSNPSFWASHEVEALKQAQQQSLWGQRLGQAIQRTVVWDGVYYVRIAECGYEYEQTFAFLPALPLLMRFLSGTSEFSIPYSFRVKLRTTERLVWPFCSSAKKWLAG